MRAGEVRRAWRALPEAGLGEVCGAGDPLVLAPHPDDESLGCGGTIARAVAEGRSPLVVVLTDGAGSHPGSAAWPGPRLAAVREAETVEAVGALGLAAGRVVFLREADTRAPREGAALGEVADRVCALVERHGCTAVLASWAHDPHCDHLAADRVARLVAERCGVAHWAYPVWGWTLPEDAEVSGGAVEGVRLGVGAHAGAKRRAVAAHRSQHGLGVGAHVEAKRRAVAAHRSQHGLVVGDDPAGFVLPRALLHHFEGAWEVFLRPGAGGGA